jgi:hypothetical protein
MIPNFYSKIYITFLQKVSICNNIRFFSNRTRKKKSNTVASFLIFLIFTLIGCSVQELKIQEIIPCEYSIQEGICEIPINGKKEYSILIPKDSKIDTWNQLSNFIYFKSRISTGFIIKFNRPFLLNEKEIILSTYKSNYNFNGIYGTIEGFDIGDDTIYSFVYLGTLLKEKQKEKKEDQKSFGKFQSLPFQINLSFKSDLFTGELETNQEIKVTKE